VADESASVAVVQGQIEAYNSRDLTGILAYYAPDGIVRDAGYGRFTDRGHDNIRAVFDSVFTANPNLHAETVEIFGAGEWVAAHVTVADFSSGDEAPRQRHWVEVYKVVDGLIQELNIYPAAT
jgi:hypothetical protein